MRLLEQTAGSVCICICLIRVELTPYKLLNVLKACDLVKRGGLLILSSPYTWKEEHTEVDKWIGGNYRDAEKCFTERGLETIVRGRGLVLREEEEDEFSGVRDA